MKRWPCGCGACASASPLSGTGVRPSRARPPLIATTHPQPHYHRSHSHHMSAHRVSAPLQASGSHERCCDYRDGARSHVRWAPSEVWRSQHARCAHLRQMHRQTRALVRHQHVAVPATGGRHPALERRRRGTCLWHDERRRCSVTTMALQTLQRASFREGGGEFCGSCGNKHGTEHFPQHSCGELRRLV